MRYYIVKKENRVGPFSEVQLREMARSGMVSQDDIICSEGLSDYAPLDSLLGVLRVSQPDRPELEPEKARASGASMRAGATPSPPIPEAKLKQAGTPLGAVRSRPYGVGGWLVFFCLLITFLVPLFTLPTMFTTWERASPQFAAHPALKNAFIFANVTIVLLLIYGIIIGILINRGKKNGKKLAKQYLVVRLVTSIALPAIVLKMMAEVPGMPESPLNSLAPIAIREFVFFLVWWLYFEKSKRIRNTYGEDPTS